MKYVDFKKFTDENGAQPIYLFEGEENYFRDKAEALLKSRFLQEATLDYSAFDGGSLKGDKMRDLVASANSFPFISEKRVVKVSEFYPSEKDYEAYLKDYFEQPSADSILMIFNTQKSKTGSAALSKKPNVTHVDCSRSDEETIKRWIYLTCKKSGVYADGITCGKIANYCLLDMSRISTEVEKLLGYCLAAQKERITDEMVEALVYADSEYKIYELANALSRKNYSEYMKIVKELSVRGFNETSLLSALSAYFKGLYESATCRGSEREIAAALGLKEYAVKKNREQASKFSKEDLLRFYETTYGAISGVKCGELTPASALKAVTARLFFEKK